MRRLVIGGCLVVGGLVIWKPWSDPEGESTHRPVQRAEHASEAGAPSTLGSTLDVGAEPVDGSNPGVTVQYVGDQGSLVDPELRSLVDHVASPRSLTARVLDSEGTPIEGAWISWTPVSERHLLRALERDHWATLGQSSHGNTDSDGRFHISLGPTSSQGDPAQSTAVLWVTHPAYASVWIDLEPEHRLPDQIELVRAGPLRLRVVDAQDRPVSGAQILTFLTDQPTLEAAARLSPAAHAAFVRSATTDGEGFAVLPQGVGEQHAIARHGEQISAPWYGRAPADVRLVLTASIRVSGQVRFPVGGGYQQGLFVTALSSTPLLARALGRSSVSEAGDYGPIEVARIEGTELILRLDGPGIQPQEKSMPLPPPVGHLTVNFEPLAGIEVKVRVRDDLGEPVALAAVRPWWQVDGEWVQAHGRAGSDGVATVSIRPGEIWLQCERPGFVEVMSGPHIVLDPPSAPLEIVLHRGGVIRGRVLRQGDPVSTFQVRYWNSESGEEGGHGVVDSADGSFLIEGVPLGDVVLCALEAGHPPSGLEHALVTPGGESQVVLHVPPALRGSGRLIDAFSSDPVPGATVQSWVTESNFWRFPTGTGAQTDASGRFEVPDLAPGANHLLIEAPGYARVTRTVRLEPGAEGVADLGTLALVPVGDLTVVLIASPSIDPRDCRVRLSRSGVDELGQFDAGGSAIFSSQRAGNVTVSVTLPDGTLVNQAEILRPGRPWRVQVEIQEDFGTGLEVQVEDWERFDGHLSVFAATLGGRGQRAEKHANLIQGRAFLPGPFGEALWVELVEGSNSVLLARHFTQEEWASGRIVLRPGSEQRTFRVVDREGHPLRGVTVMLTIQPNAGWMSWGETDSSGHVKLAVPPERSILVQLRFPDKGGVVDRALALPGDPEREIVLVLDTDATLELMFHDRGFPMHGVKGVLESPTGLGQLFVGAADAAGRADAGAIGSGPYVVKVDEHDLWPLRLPIQVRPGENRRTVEVRRIGGLTLTATRPAGQPLPDAAVSLRSLEFDEDVADWVAQGRIHAPPGGLRTDGEGRLRVTGLPNGPYRYSVLAGDGGTAAGEVTVPAHGEGRAEVVVAPP